MWTSISGFIAILCLTLLMVPPLQLVWVEKLATGFDQAYRFHHVVGMIVVPVMVWHAALAMWPYLGAAENPSEAIGFFFDPTDLTTLIGTSSLLVFGLVVATAGMWSLRRPVWLWLHRLSLLGFALAMGHVASAWLSHGTYGFLNGLGRIMLAIAVMAVALAHVVRALRPELLVPHRTFVTKAVDSLEPGTVSLRLQLDRGRGSWRSGEFGFFRFVCRGPCGVSRERHPFTVVGTSRSNEIEIVVKAVGDDTTRLQNIIVGTKGEVLGPYGSFEPLITHARPQVWIAGGLGLMPFLGLLRRQASENPDGPKIALVYLFRPGQSPLFLSELEHLATECGRLRFFALESAPSQELGIDAIAHLIPDWREREFAIAGPHPMVEYWTRILRAQGIPRADIHSEDFLK